MSIFVRSSSSLPHSQPTLVPPLQVQDTITDHATVAFSSRLLVLSAFASIAEGFRLFTMISPAPTRSATPSIPRSSEGPREHVVTMASAITPWLWPGIERELRQTLEWQGGAPGSTPAGKVPKYEDDFSNLRVQSTQLKHRVQILKVKLVSVLWITHAEGLQFLTFENPIKVILSDKSISIPATIASEAALAFEKKYWKRITEGTRGCVIQLLQFEIVVTHLGEPSEQLTLLVQEFKHLGSDGSGTFGEPQPISGKGSLRILLAELTGFRNREAAKRRVGQNGLNTRSSCSEEYVVASDGKNEDGERDFATQKPRWQANHHMPKHHIPRPLYPIDELQERREFRRRRADGDLGQESLLHSQLPELGHTTNPAVGRQFKDEVAKTTRPVVTSRITGNESPTSKGRGVNITAKLISLLRDKRGGKSTDHNEPTLVNESKELTLSNGHPASVVAPSGQPERAEIENIIDEAAIAAQSMSYDTSGSPQGSGRDETTLTGLKRAHSQCGAREVDRTSAAQNIHGSSPHLGYDQVADDSTINLTAKEKLLTVEEIEDPWQGMILIRKKDKFIPAAQEKLLNRKDCWLPPERGERAPVSNIPLDILQSLTESVECPAASTDDDPGLPNKRQKIMQKGRSDKRLQLSDSGHVSDEEGEEEIPFQSSDWPPSPPVLRKINELPPDSSAEAPSPVKLDQPRESQKSEKTGSPQDVKSSKSNSRTSSPVQEAFSICQSPRSSTRSLIDQEAGCEFPGVNQNLLEPASMDAEKHDQSQDFKHSDVVTIEDEGMKPASSPPVSRYTRKEVNNLDSDAAVSSQSDLEMTVPNALQNHGRFPYGNERQLTPLRTYNNPKSTLQVDRTPDTVQYQRTKGKLYPLAMNALPLLKQSSKRNVGEGQSNSRDAEVSIQVMVPGTFSQSDHADRVVADVDESMINQAPDAPMMAKTFGYVSHNSPDIIEPKPTTADVSPAVSRKRQVEEINDSSSNVTKRRKHIKFAAPDVEDDGDDEKPREDPSTRARQLRREFMNNLRAMTNASAAPPSPLLSDVDLRGPVIPQAKTDAQSDVRQQDKHAVNPGSSTVWQTGPQTPDESTSPTKSSPIKRKKISTSQVHDHEETDGPAISAGVLAPAVPAQETILERFRGAYPEYGGNEKQFVSLCRKIDALAKESRMLHKSLWDDFVIRHQKEYRAHLARCADEAEDPMPYEMFYSAEIDEPQFMRRILSPANLAEAISSGTPVTKQSPVQVNPVVMNTIDLTQTTPEPQVSEVHQPGSSSKSAVVTAQVPSRSVLQSNESVLSRPRPILSTTARKTPRRLPWSTANPSTPTPSSSRHQNFKTSRKSMASSPASSSNDPFVAPKSVTQPAASNIAVAGPSSTAPLRAPPTQSSTAKSTPSHKGKAAVGKRDSKPIVPPATAGPALSATKGTSSTKPKSTVAPSHNPRKQETTLPSATPSKPWYLDPVNPFKLFARANASIRSGADNGFVEEKDRQEKGRPVIVNEDGVVMAEIKKVDVLGWHL